MRDMLDDIRFTWRSVRRRPAFAFTAIVTLALAIGVNTGVFTLVNTLLLKPLPVSRPERLAEFYTSRDDRVGGVTSYPDLKDLQHNNTSFSGLAGHSFLFASLSWKGRSEVLVGEFATSNYAEVLGIRPRVGRFFTPQEEQVEGAGTVAVIGNRFWESRYGSDPGALGQTLQLNGRKYTIVGVMPAGFEGTFPGIAPEVWIPVMMADSLDSFGQIDTVPSPGKTKIERRGFRWLWVTGRLKDGVSLSQARSEMQSLMAALAAEYPQSNKDAKATLKASREVRLNPELDGPLTAASAFLLVAAGIVLLVACTNVAGLFLARSTSRRREIAVRLALGTGRARLIQQLLIESISIGMIGGATGLLLSVLGGRLLMSIPLPIPITIHWNLEPDWRVFLFNFGVSLIAGVSFGLMPAIQATRRDLMTDLRGSEDGRSSRRMIFRSGLVATQIALSLVLLVGAGLLIRSLDSAAKIDLGFAPEHYALVSLNLGMFGYADGRSETFYADLQQRFRGVPNVEAVSISTRTPLSININTTSLYPTATPDPGSAPVGCDSADVDPGYFETLRIAILEGRAIDSGDKPGSPVVAVVSQAMAKQVWPGQSAIGKQMRSLSGRTIEIVGVSKDYKVRSVGESPRPMIHFARQQSPNPSSALVVRTAGRAATVLALLREQIAAIDPDVVPFQLTTLEEETSHSLFPVRTGAAVLAGLGAFTVFLAGVGLYGLIACSVSRRTREIGTRIALGATRIGIVRQVILEGSMLVVIGGLAGLAGAAVVGRLMRSLLYGISSIDWAAFLVGTLVLAAITLLANAIPAIAASRVDPIRALRMD